MNLHQLIYTSCRPGRSLNGSGGYTVRAASAGLDPVWIDSAATLARPPAPNTGDGECIRLALQRREGSVAAVNTVNLLDHDRREATFTHAIIDPTGNLDPRRAITAWGSTHWRRSDDDSSGTLPVIDQLPSGTSISWPSVQQRLQNAKFSALSRFLLATWMQHKDKRIILIAGSQSVAEALWLLVHCLPSRLLSDLTFATSDRDPTGAGVAVVGCHEHRRSTMDYSENWYCLETGTGSQHDSMAYADFAIQEITAGRWATIEEFVRICESLELGNTYDVDLLHRVCHESHTCTQSELQQCAGKHGLLKWLLQNDHHRRLAAEVIAEAVCQGQGADISGLIAHLRNDESICTTLRAALVKQMSISLTAGDTSTSARLLEVVTDMSASAPADALWRDLVSEINPHEIPLQSRLWLASELCGQFGMDVREPSLIPLLQCKIEDCPQVLKSTSDTAIQVEAIGRAVERQKGMPCVAAQALARNPHVLERLTHRIGDPTTLVCAIAEHDPIAAITAICGMKADSLNVDVSKVLDNIFQANSLRPSDLVTQALSHHWGTLLSTHHASGFIALALAVPALEARNGTISELLLIAHRLPTLNASLRDRIERRIMLVQALANHTEPIAKVDSVLNAIQEVPLSEQSGCISELMPRIASRVIASPPDETRRQIRHLLELAEHSDHSLQVFVLRQLAIVGCSRRRLLRDVDVAELLLRYAFGAHRPLNGTHLVQDDLIDFGVQMIDTFARAGGPKCNRILRGRANDWPEPARTYFRLGTRRSRVNGAIRAFFARRRARLDGA